MTTQLWYVTPTTSCAQKQPFDAYLPFLDMLVFLLKLILRGFGRTFDGCSLTWDSPPALDTYVSLPDTQVAQRRGSGSAEPTPQLRARMIWCVKKCHSLEVILSFEANIRVCSSIRSSIHPDRTFTYTYTCAHVHRA